VSAIRAAFREYYFKTKNVEEPDRIAQREFGYNLFAGGMIRHLSFPNVGSLLAALVKEAPSDVYCSNAYYRFPTKPMQEKEWLGANLIFDIDAKDLNPPCVATHSYLACSNCEYAADVREQKAPFSCPACSGSQAVQVSIPCPKCIDASKKELRELLAFLTRDLGISRDSIRTYFSGNNGFHVHISDGQFDVLDTVARSDIVGYISGYGLMPESVGVRKGRDAHDCTVKMPRGGIGYGWRNKVADRLKIDSPSVLRLHNLVVRVGGYSAFKSELERITKDLGVRIDAQVTTDVHRIFRMPGTINSKSGLAKVPCADVDSFDPFTDARVLGDGVISVQVRSPVRFRLGGKTQNIPKGSVELPAYVAVYLMCKGLADAA
jgi:DNA primase small subunit